ncbi:MAG TPA: energy transducer TonB [Gemmatimonadaceae bacterium]
MSLRTIAVAGMVAFAAACATGGGKSARGAGCDLRDRDSVFAVIGPVYRDCAVDRAAHLLSTQTHPDYRPTTPRSTCYSADLEFVVDAAGRPEVPTIQVVRANDQGFAESVLAMVRGWRYDPAVREGRAVRQIVTSHQVMGTMVVAVPKGASPPSGPPTQRQPSC